MTVTALMSTGAINLNDLLRYELAVVPTSIFDEKSGQITIATSKSILKQKPQVEVTNSSIGFRDTVFLGRCAISVCCNARAKGSSRVSH